MNKTKMMLAATGGAIGLAVLVVAYFTWSAFSAKTVAKEGDDEEGIAGLETVLSRAQTLSRKEVYPCAASLKAIESNRTVLVEWQGEASKLARRGDRVFEKTTPAAFKEFLVADARRLTALSGNADGALVKPDFAFGPFRDYISGGKMPAEAELAELQRKWDDVATVVEILAQGGVAELTGVDFAAAVNVEEVKGQRSEVRGQRSKVKGQRSEVKGQRSEVKGQRSKVHLTSDLGPLTYSYVFSFSAKPAAFVRVLNAFVTSERFVTVEGFSFTRPKDVIAEALGGEEKSAAAAAAPARRRRRGAAAEEEKKDGGAAAKGGIVTDPILDGPLSVVLTVNVRDFRSLEEDKDEKDEEVKK